MIVLTNLLAVSSLLGQNTNMSTGRENTINDNSSKSILARGCDPVMSASAARAIPPHIGNPEYVPTTKDDDFIEQLKSRKWSVIFFAPGACRISAAGQTVPGSNVDTRGWTMEQYRQMVYKIQGDEVQVVETFDERETIGLLKAALSKANPTSGI